MTIKKDDQKTNETEGYFERGKHFLGEARKLQEDVEEIEKEVQEALARCARLSARIADLAERAEDD